HPTIDWDQAAGRLQAHSSIATIMGDWAKGYFTANKWTADKDFTGVPSPGTGKTYMIVCDTFGLPKGAPDRDNAINWLKVCGSEAGQAAFNPNKEFTPEEISAMILQKLKADLAQVVVDAVDGVL